MTDDTCRKCGGAMKPGKAIAQTYTPGTPDEAKAAAQADYEARIRHALVVTPAPDVAQAVAGLEEIIRQFGDTPGGHMAAHIAQKTLVAIRKGKDAE